MFTFKNILTSLLLVLSFSVANAQLKVGNILPKITLQNDSETAISLDQFNGKTLLIDFWASWCAPCRQGNKNLVKLNQKYKEQGLEVVSISIDTDKTKWIKAIKKDGMKHTQLIDPKGFKAPSAVQFGVEGLPALYLFDTKGKLIAINPTDKQIIDQLKKTK